jgi:hypothetical protein
MAEAPGVGNYKLIRKKSPGVDRAQEPIRKKSPGVDRSGDGDRHSTMEPVIYQALPFSGVSSGYAYILIEPREAGDKIPQMTFLRCQPRNLTA